MILHLKLDSSPRVVGLRQCLSLRATVAGVKPASAG